MSKNEGIKQGGESRASIDQRKADWAARDKNAELDSSPLTAEDIEREMRQRGVDIRALKRDRGKPMA